MENTETGAELIAAERQLKQIEKHGFTAEHHANNPQWYDKGQLLFAAHLLSLKDGHPNRQHGLFPEGWDKGWFLELMNKPYLRRLTIGGAFFASEIDRIMFINQLKTEQ